MSIFDGYRNSPVAPTPQEGLQGVAPLLPGTVIDFQQGEIVFPFDGGSDTATPADGNGSTINLTVPSGYMNRIIYFYGYTSPISTIFRLTLSYKNENLGSTLIPSQNAVANDTSNTGNTVALSNLVGSSGFTVATATVPGTLSNLNAGDWVSITGVTVPSGINTYNGIFQVVGISFNAFHYAMPGTATQQPNAFGQFLQWPNGSKPPFGFSLLTIPTQTKAGSNPVGYPAASFLPVNPFTAGGGNEQTSLLLNPVTINAVCDKITVNIASKFANNNNSPVINQLRMYLACESHGL